MIVTSSIIYFNNTSTNSQQTESFNPVASIWSAMIKDVIGGESCKSKVSKLAYSDSASKRAPPHKRYTTSSRISFLWACHW